MRQLKKIVLAAGIALMPLAGMAAVIFGTGNPGNSGTDNVVFTPCANEVLTGTTVSGCLNGTQTTYVNFTSDETLSVNGGQALIEAVDGSFNDLLIQMQDGTLGFSKIIFNINAIQGDVGTISIIANLFAPPGGTFSSGAFSLGNGSNFFYVETNAGEVIQSLSFSSSVGVNAVEFQDTRQVRLGVTDAPSNVCPPGTTGTPPACVPDRSDVPEPGSLALVGLALTGLGFMSRRKRA